MAMNTHWWGRPLPKNYDGPAWGARAIFDAPPDVWSYLFDRKSATREPGDTAMKALYRWLDDYGIPEIRRQAAGINLTKSDETILTHEADGYVLEASPNGSCGYVHLACWKGHTADSDCSVGEDGCCSECGVSHGEPCDACGGRGFHLSWCERCDA